MLNNKDNKKPNKEVTIFYHMCKNLNRYIQRKIFKKYVSPDIINSKKKSYTSLNNETQESNTWKYYDYNENLTEEEKLLDIFKDNAFLAQLQKHNESLENLLTSLDENMKNIECLQKNIELGEKKIEFLSQLNTQLNQFFSKNTDSQSPERNINMGKNNNQNILDKINLVKSLDILNDLQLFNPINDINKKKDDSTVKHSNSSNTTITNNNNIILDNKIINNNIESQKNKAQHSEEGEIMNDNYNNSFNNGFGLVNKTNFESNKSPSFLNKKYKREHNDQELTNKEKKPYMKNYRYNYKLMKNKEQNNNNNMNKNFQNSFNKNEYLNKNCSYINNDYKEKSTNSINSFNIDEHLNENDNKLENEKKKEEENIVKDNNMTKVNDIINENENSLEINFDKILKSEFPSLFSFVNISDSKKEIMKEIKNIIKQISNLKYNQKNRFDDPILVGTYSHFELINIINYLPPIDILFKCKNIKGFDELKIIAEETMKKKLNLSYMEVSNNYDKKNEMVKIINKCKIKIGNINKNDNIFIFINLIFVGVGVSTFNKKEEIINQYFFGNNLFDNKGKILISLFFRRWRRKFKLFFLMPEIIDIIVNSYFNENNSYALIIQEIYYDLFNGEIKLKSNNKDEKTIKEIKEFINEWFNNIGDKNDLNNAIIKTQELIMNNDFYSTFNEETK